MSEVFTLTVSSKIADHARQVANQTGKPVEAVLSEWLEQVTANEEANPVESDLQYEVWTPFDSIETAVALQEFIDQQRRQDT